MQSRFLGMQPWAMVKLYLQEVNSVSDSNPSNNERRLDLDVKNYHKGNDLNNNFPTPSPGQSIARLGHGTQYVNVSVVNDGVLPLSAVLAVTLQSYPTQLTR